jgi:hypothetical protein
LTPSLKLRWERHTEIQTYAFTRCLPDAETRRAVLEAPFDADNVAMSLVPKEWAREIPGGVVCATHVAVMTDEDRGDGSSGAFWSRWSPYDRVDVVNADP